SPSAAKAPNCGSWPAGAERITKMSPAPVCSNKRSWVPPVARPTEDCAVRKIRGWNSEPSGSRAGVVTGSGPVQVTAGGSVGAGAGPALGAGSGSRTRNATAASAATRTTIRSMSWSVRPPRSACSSGMNRLCRPGGSWPGIPGRAARPDTGSARAMATVRYRTLTEAGVDEGATVIIDGTGTAHAQVLAELQGLRQRVDRVAGSVVATCDGIVIAHDLGAAETYGVEPSGVAALAAVGLGLSQRMTDTASHGELLETVIRGRLGQVMTYAAGERALLTVLVRGSGEPEGLYEEARRVAARVADALVDSWQDDAAVWRSER